MDPLPWDGLLPSPSRQECIWYVSFLVFFAPLTCWPAAESIVSTFPGVLRAPAWGGWREGCRRAPAPGEGVTRQGGEMPEEDASPPPRAAPGSRNLPWDARSIPAKQTNPQAGALPGAGGWDGGLACARAVGGGIGHGSGTSGTAKIPNACDWCVAGMRRSGNGSVGRHLKGVRSTRRRSGPGGSKVPAGASRLLTAIPRWPRRLCRRARGHATKPLFRACCATGRVVTSLRGTRVERRPRIAAMRAAGPSVGCGTASASTWPARRKWAG